MAPAAHTNQTPSSGNIDNGAGITTGVRFTVDTTLSCTHIAFWVPTTNTGTYTVALYQTTADDDPEGSGTGTLLASASVGSGSVTADGWAEVAITPQTLSPGVIYTAARHSAGRYVASGGVFNGASITGNGVTLLALGSAPNPPGIGSIVNGVFVEGASIAYPVSEFNYTDYFVDVVVAAGETGVLTATFPEFSASVVANASSDAVLSATAPAFSVSLANTPDTRAKGTQTLSTVYTSTSSVAQGGTTSAIAGG